MNAELAQRFHAEMHAAYREAKDLGYTASYFLRMVDELGGVAAARKLVNDPTPSEGFTRLWEMGRLDLSVEARVLQPRFALLDDLVWYPHEPTWQQVAKGRIDYGLDDFPCLSATRMISGSPRLRG